jgi:hypothetical protein
MTMNPGYVTPIALAACGAVSACTKETTLSQIDRKMTVSGSHEAVERFVALQRSLRPRIAASVIEVLLDGRSSATATIPVTHSGTDLVHTAREALAAGLSYEVKDERSTNMSGK